MENICFIHSIMRPTSKNTHFSLSKVGLNLKKYELDVDKHKITIQ